MAPVADASFAEITAKRRGRIRRFFYARPRTTDALVALSYLLLAATTIVDSLLSGGWLAALLMFAVAGSLFFRRTHPIPVVAFVAVAEVAVTLLHPWGSNVSAGLWFSLYSVAVSHTRRFSFVVLGAVTAPLALLYLLAAVGPPDASMLPAAAAQAETESYLLVTSIATGAAIALSNVVATGIGISVRQRRDHEAEIAAWASRTARLGSVNERNRIAREMHDVVAHSLTVMISLSDGASVVVRKSPERAGEVLGELSRTGRTALADMRRVLGVLRDDRGEDAATRVPLAPHESLQTLLDGFRATGMTLHYSHTGPALPEDPAFRLTVYRIVQESLTNALRYGRPLATVTVGVIRKGSCVSIDVLDDGRAGPGTRPQPQGTGQGLAGMSERARIYSGTLNAGRTGTGGWLVHADLNWTGDKNTTTLGDT